MLVEMELVRVVVSEISDQHAIYLGEKGGGRRFPILIGPHEAEVINRRLLEEPSYRPLTHDLLRNVMVALSAEPRRVVVTEMKEHTYYAVLEVESQGTILQVDCRPSDAVALAVHYSPFLPIFVSDDVLDSSA